jgi:hypothetical protein
VDTNELTLRQTTFYHLSSALVRHRWQTWGELVVSRVCKLVTEILNDKAVKWFTILVFRASFNLELFSSKSESGGKSSNQPATRKTKYKKSRRAEMMGDKGSVTVDRHSPPPLEACLFHPGTWLRVHMWYPTRRRLWLNGSSHSSGQTCCRRPSSSTPDRFDTENRNFLNPIRSKVRSSID